LNVGGLTYTTGKLAKESKECRRGRGVGRDETEPMIAEESKECRRGRGVGRDESERNALTLNPFMY